MKVTALESKVADNNIKYEVVEVNGVSIIYTYIRSKNDLNGNVNYTLVDTKVIHNLP